MSKRAQKNADESNRELERKMIEGDEGAARRLERSATRSGQARFYLFQEILPGGTNADRPPSDLSERTAIRLTHLGGNKTTEVVWKTPVYTILGMLELCQPPAGKRLAMGMVRIYDSETGRLAASVSGLLRVQRESVEFVEEGRDEGIYEGIWTPSGRVVCLQCHGRYLEAGVGDTPRYSRRYQTRDTISDPQFAETTCEQCGRRIAVAVKVARERNLLIRIANHFEDRLRSAHMSQTGGMNSAVVLDTPGRSGAIVVAYEWEYDAFMVVRFRPGGWEEGTDDGTILSETASEDEVIDLLETIL